jgi:hypothetical protein
MKKLYLNERFKHFIEWFLVLLFIIHNRGKNSYGANGLKRIVQRYLLEYSSSKEQLKEAEKALREIENLLQVTNIRGLKRLGAKNDGGYIGTEPDSKLVVLSGGGGKNIDFEIELAENGSKIHIYDPTISKLPREHKNVTHLKYALTVPEDKTFKRSVRLSEAYSALCSDSSDPAWLKLDIEGSEIKLLSEDLALLSKFQQIFVEFHDTYQVVDPIFRNQFISILKTLQESHYVIAMVSNNWQGVTNFGNAFLPVTFEVTFLSRQFAVEVSEDNDYKTLKAANNPKRPEIPDLPFHIPR